MAGFFRNLCWLALLLLSPDRFRQIAIADDTTRLTAAARKVDPGYTPSSEYARDMEETYRKRTEALRQGMGMSLLLIIVALGLAWLTVVLLRRGLGFTFGSETTQWLQLASLLLVVWATLSELGWEIQSWSGTTMPERLNRFWFRGLYFLGTYIFALTFFTN
jgi:hypothetical protein